MPETKRPNPLVTLALLALAYWLAFGFGGGVFSPPGPRLVVIVRESADDSPAFSRMVTNVRDGAVAKALSEGKHQVDLFDDDDAAAAKWLPALQGVQQPAALVILPPDKVLAKQSLPADVKAETILALVKANGGL